MKPCETAIEPLWRLVQTKRSWFRRERLSAPGEERARELLGYVVAAGDYRALPHIVWLLGAADDGVVRAAADGTLDRTEVPQIPVPIPNLSFSLTF